MDSLDNLYHLGGMGLVFPLIIREKGGQKVERDIDQMLRVALIVFIVKAGYDDLCQHTHCTQAAADEHSLDQIRVRGEGGYVPLSKLR